MARRNAGELVARLDVELGEHLVQVVLDRSGADEQLGADLGVRETVAGEPRDLCLLGCEVVARLRTALVRGFAGCFEFATSALGEGGGPDAAEPFVCGTKLFTGVDAPFLPTKPFAVDELGAGEVNDDSTTAEPLDSLSVETLGLIALAYESLR